jgi:hypothetical protein
MPETYKRSGLAIINPYGGIWTDRLFESDTKACEFLKRFWGDEKDLSGFKLAYAHLEISLHQEKNKPVFVPLPNGVLRDDA